MAYLALIKSHSPLSIEESLKANRYLDRSFNNFNDMEIVSDFDNVLRYALNVAVTPCVTFEDRENVASILRFYQPTFPENRLHPHLNNINEEIKTCVDNLFENNSEDIAELLFEDKLLLNYYSREYSESRSSLDNIMEITAYLIPLPKFKGDKHSYPWPTFQANDYPKDELEKCEEEDVIPLIVKSEYAINVTGSELVPSFPLKNISKYLSLNATDSVKVTYWRRGRNWDQSRQGVSKKTGYFITISKDHLKDLKTNYKLIWQIYYKHKAKYIDVFEQKVLK